MGISSHTSFVYLFGILPRRKRPLYTSFVYLFLHSARYLTAYFQISSHMSFASHRIRPLYTLYALSGHFEVLSHTSCVYLSRILPFRIRFLTLPLKPVPYVSTLPWVELCHTSGRGSGH